MIARAFRIAKAFLGVLGAERLKVRRTPVAPLVLIAPYIVVVFFGLFAYFDGRRFLTQANAWPWLMSSAFTFWCLLVVPLWTALLTSQVAAVEHRCGGLGRLFVSPVQRSIPYAAKQTLMWGLVTLAFVWQAGAIVVAGLLLRGSRPGLGFEGAVPWGDLTLFAVGGSLTTFFLVAVHTWVALERTDVALPMAVGFLATLSVLVLHNVDATLVVYHPWAWPSLWVSSVVDGTPEPAWAVVGWIGGASFAAVVGWRFVRRDVL